MIFLIKHIRKIIFVFSLTLAGAIYVYLTTTISSPSAQRIQLAETYALTAITYLYFALLASPLYSAFPRLPTKSVHLVGRRLLGLSAFGFACLHAYFAFFGLLGGFAGLAFLSSRYLIAISCSFTALVILTLMASTSWDRAVRYLGKNWKRLHRFVYLAGFLIVTHALMLGSDFSSFNSPIAQIATLALVILLVLELVRFDKFLVKRFDLSPAYSLVFVLGMATLTLLAYLYIAGPNNTVGSGLSVHSSHIQLAKDAQTNTNQTSNIPGLSGDRSKRYNVSFSASNTEAVKDTLLNFKVSYASNGQAVTAYRSFYEKFTHLIIVDSSLTYFAHIHPMQSGSEFSINHAFPKSGKYYLYLDFQPLGAIEQNVAFSQIIGTGENQASQQPLDSNLTKDFGDLEITLSSPPLKASDMSVGKQKITFSFKDKTTKQPVTNLKPYLGSFGHLVMINQSTYDYVHVHPYSLVTPLPNANGGPSVDFLPIGIYGPFKPGTYRVFGQFNHNGNLVVADFTVKVSK